MDLINKYLNSLASPEEEKELLDLLNSSPEDLKKFQEEKTRLDSIAFIESVNWPETEKGYAILSKKIAALEHSRKMEKRWKTIYYYTAAAAAIFLFSLIVTPWLFEPQEAAIDEYSFSTTVELRHGEYKQVILDDGTVVWLNPGTTLAYSSFEENQKREVYISGKGYFEVAQDSLAPFIVITDMVDIEVLGTKFNIECYEADKVVETTVIEGSVALYDKSRDLDSKRVDITLVKDQQATFIKESKSFLISDVEATDYKQWKDGILLFKEKRFEDIALELERKFAITISFSEDTLKGYTFTATFDKESSLEDIFDSFSLSAPIKYTIYNDKVLLTTK